MISGHIQALSVDTNVIRVVHVLDRDIQPVQPGKQRYRLPINRLAIQRLLQKFGRLLHFDRVLKGLHRLVGERRHLAQNVHHALGNAILGHKGDIAVPDLQRDGHQHRA